MNPPRNRKGEAGNPPPHRRRARLLSQRAVRKATAEFLAHYQTERNHQGLEKALLCPDPGHAVIEGKVHRRERLGGLLNYCYRKAA